LSTGNNNPALGNNLTPAIFGSGRIAALRVNFNGATATGFTSLGTFAPTLPGQNGITGLNLAAGHLDGDTFDEVVVGQLRGAQAQGQAYRLLIAGGGLNGAPLGAPVPAYNPASVAANELALGATRGFFTAIAEKHFDIFGPTQPAVPPLGATVNGATRVTFDLRNSTAGSIRDLILDLESDNLGTTAQLDIDLTFTPTGGAPIAIPVIATGQGQSTVRVTSIAISDSFFPRLDGTPTILQGGQVRVGGNFAPATGFSLLNPGGNSLVGDSAKGVWTLTIDNNGSPFNLDNANLIIGYSVPGTGAQFGPAAGPTTPGNRVLSSQITFPPTNNGAIISNIEVFFNISSAAAGNVFTVELVHLAPDNTQLARTTLLNTATIANNNATRYLIALNDRDPTDVQVQQALPEGGTIIGTFRGQGGASITDPFRGQYVAGIWQLVVTDTGAASPLTLNSWGLNIIV
jgi:hypothetical protein